MLRAPLVLALAGLAALPAYPAAAGSPAQWCQSARAQVVEWSLAQAQGRGRPYVTAIRHTRTALDRVIESPDNGVVLRCLGRATLSNGVTTGVNYGFRSIDGTWYLFLKRTHRTSTP